MKKTNKRTHRITSLLTITALITVILCTTGFVVSANSDKSFADTDSYYQSVRIDSGDTLWSIAEEYCPDKLDIYDYIDDIKDINNIKNNTIKAGEYLIVTVYK